ncbi:MAG: type III pantothenate kinase [Bacteroidales bacterium]|nr:type III pantothenate kinase [Bacteroidales bacterium]
MRTGIIDIGNTALKAGIFEDRRIVDFSFSPKIETFHNFFRGIDEMMVASVAGISKEVRDEVRSLPLSDDRVIFWDKYNPNIRLPFRCERTETVGIDRLALAAGAVALYPESNVLCIALGTCVTYNLITSDGVFLPEAISLGLSARLRAMHREAPALPLIELSAKDTSFATDTTENMLHGSLYGLWYEILGYIEQHGKQRENLITIITGGDLVYYEKYVSKSLRIFAIPNLVLKGLDEILQHNKK